MNWSLQAENLNKVQIGASWKSRPKIFKSTPPKLGLQAFSRRQVSGLYSTHPGACRRLWGLGNALEAFQLCVLQGVGFSIITGNWYKIINGSNTVLVGTWKSYISPPSHQLLFSTTGTQTSVCPLPLARSPQSTDDEDGDWEGNHLRSFVSLIQVRAHRHWITVPPVFCHSCSLVTRAFDYFSSACGKGRAVPTHLSTHKPQN